MPVLACWRDGSAHRPGLGRRRLRLRRLRFVHGRRHPLAGHVEKLVPKLGVLGQSGKPHALARVADAIIIWGRGHHALLPELLGAGGSATGLSATSAWIGPRPVMMQRYPQVPAQSVGRPTLHHVFVWANTTLYAATHANGCRRKDGRVAKANTAVTLRVRRNDRRRVLQEKGGPVSDGTARAGKGERGKISRGPATVHCEDWLRSR